MSSKITACPACDGTSLRRKEIEETMQVPYGPETKRKQVVIVCNDCGIDIDDSEVNDEVTEKALEVSRRESITRMLDDLAGMGYSLAGLERALELPQRTISRWKASTDVSSGGLALLRIIRTYPWIVDVADNKYASSYAKSALLHQAAEIFIEKETRVATLVRFDATSNVQEGLILFKKQNSAEPEVVNTSAVTAIGEAV